MVIKNVLAFGENGFEKRNIFAENGRITDFAPKFEGEIINGEGLLALPGLVDIHLHGAAGHDFCEGNETAIAAIAEYEASRGVLAFCPAVMSYDEKTLTAVVKAAAEHENSKGSDLVGINMEGPFLNPKRAGAQNPKYLQNPDAEMFTRLQRAADGLIKLVDIAPELAGGFEFAERLCKTVKVSLAHSDCDYDCAKRFFALGASHITHLFNAMNGINHRSPGPIAAAWESDCTAELIADGVHIHPSVVKLAFELFDGRLILISDSMMSCGLPDGEYSLGGQRVTVSGRRCTLTEQPDTLAGSCTDLFGCLKSAVEMGVPIEKAVAAASIIPAKAIAAAQDYGSLAAGRFANIILTDAELNIVRVIQKGKIIA